MTRNPINSPMIFIELAPKVLATLVIDQIFLNCDRPDSEATDGQTPKGRGQPPMDGLPQMRSL